MRSRSLTPVTLALTLLLGAAVARAADPAGSGAAAPAKEGAKMEQTGKNPIVVISTSMGDIEAELYADKAPESVKNFLAYANDGFYNGTVFHRVIKDFMIQGGGMTPDMKEKATRAPIPLESGNGLDNVRGTLAMARTMDPNSATAQFFINVTDNGFLNKAQSRDGNGYAVFGKVVSGMEVVDKIRAVPTGNKGMHQNVPLEPVLINKATLEK